MNDATRSQDTLLGHPKGLFVLFFTELWERFSFYSMRGILTLYTAGVVLAALGTKAGGQADAIYGAYLGFVYSSTFIGGMLADRLLGQRRAIYIGGTLMAVAQFTLAAHALQVRGGTPVDQLNWLFFLGLGLLSAGNGFFKPNISTIVGTLYSQGDGRRDAAFTIFYMGINIGAFLASFSAGLAQKYGWHLGFMLAGSGMILGQLIFLWGRGAIEGKGLPPEGASLQSTGPFGIPHGLTLALGIGLFIPLVAYLIAHPQWVQSLALMIAGPIVLYLLWEATRGSEEESGRGLRILVLGVFTMIVWAVLEQARTAIMRGTEQVADGNSFVAYLASHPLWVRGPLLVISVSTVLYFLWKATREGREEAGRMIVILVLCSFSMMFWGFFELAGSTITRFTEEVVNRRVLGTEVQAAFLANFVNPLLIIVLSIPAAAVWVWLDRKRMEPSSPLKFVLGLGFLSLGFVMLLLGAKEAQAATSGKCAMIWLLLAFFFHTTGELCLSPVGLSTITKLSPARLVGMFMGVWFLSSALGNVLAPWVAGSAAGLDFNQVFLRIAMITAGGAAALLLLVPTLKRMMHGVK